MADAAPPFFFESPTVPAAPVASVPIARKLGLGTSQVPLCGMALVGAAGADTLHRVTPRRGGDAGQAPSQTPPEARM